jgi:type IV pilus assembly protein PilW
MPAAKTLGYGPTEVAPVLGVLDVAASGLRGTASITANRVAQTDLLVVTRGSSQSFVLAANPSGAGANTTIALPSRSPIPSSPSGLNNTQQDVLIISDCSQADIFHVAGVTPSDPQGAAATVTANVDLAALGRNYRAGAMVMGLETTAYFIRLLDPSKAEGPNNPRSLYRARWAPDASDSNGNPDIDQVVENVQNMRVLFGVDSNGDGSADGYFRTAQFDGNAGSPTWNQVISVRVSLLLRSASNTAASQSQPYKFDTDGDGDLDAVTPSDRHLYRVHTATMAIRNRASGG